MNSPFDLRQLKSRFIFNPTAGHNSRDPSLLAKTKSFITEHNLDASVDVTERPHHATELAHRAVEDGCKLVVAIGGDGTLNETATALVNTEIAFGLIPCGSGNGLGRHLKLFGDPEIPFNALLNGRIKAIDTGSANGHPFFTAMGLGFDAEVSSRFNRLTRRGMSAYVRTTLKAWFSYRPEHYVIAGDSLAINTEAFIVAVGNADQYGNDCFISPGAQVDDGRLNLTILKRVNTLTVPMLAWRMFGGTIHHSPTVICADGEHFIIKRASAGVIHTDAEIRETGAEVAVEIHPQSLQMVVPT
ncbi:MAG: YegS/Rv2252/BmrU family lipid kinase [Opitutaceae bacterium]|jgi:diacylglycerol kinase (ATP)|nr:YegS/Rv2252/BmrU family lipid kinase [Opitutaceae bacterium]